MKMRLVIALALTVLALIANTTIGALDTTFAGPNYSPPDYSGEILNGGALRLQSGDGSSSISATFTRGGSGSMNFSDNLVLFIDSTSGGFQNTEQFSGAAEGLLSAASGVSTFNARSTAYFNPPTGGSFGADYVIAMGTARGGAVFRINPDGALQQVQTFTVSPYDDQRSRSYTFSFDWSSIGVTDPSSGGFRFYSSYVGDFGARRLDSMEGISGIAGFNASTFFSDYRIFGVEPVPEMTNVALAVFGGLVLGGGLAMRARKYLARRKLTTSC
jgi:hypothetical protein